MSFDYLLNEVKICVFVSISCSVRKGREFLIVLFFVWFVSVYV